MISSMTGFGQAVTEAEGILYTVEIRSLNNRYFKIQLRLPEMAAFMEDELEKLHRSIMQRGSVSFSLRMKNVTGRALFDIDENALRDYVNRLTGLISPDNAGCRIDLAAMLSLPGVVQPTSPDSEMLETIRRTVLALARQAIDQLMLSRREEGQLLAEDLGNNCRQIRQNMELIRGRQDQVLREYHERLKKRVEDLLAQAQLSLDQDLLAREVAIFAERCDIAEEVIRLDTHLGQFERCVKAGGPIGRRLDFIAQELLREANTIASKASDALIAQCVIEIKCAVDRIKEQVQNVE